MENQPSIVLSAVSTKMLGTVPREEISVMFERTSIQQEEHSVKLQVQRIPHEKVNTKLGKGAS